MRRCVNFCCAERRAFIKTACNKAPPLSVNRQSVTRTLSFSVALFAPGQRSVRAILCHEYPSLRRVHRNRSHALGKRDLPDYKQVRGTINGDTVMTVVVVIARG